MSNIKPIRDSFENPKAMLHHIAEDEEIASFVIVVFHKDGTAIPTHLNCTRKEMAFAGAVMQHHCLEDEI